MRTAVVVLMGLTLAACGKLLAIDEDASPSPATDGGAPSDDSDGAVGDATGSADGAFLSDGGCSGRFCCNFDSPNGCGWTDEDNPDDAGFAAFGPSMLQASSRPNSLRVLTDGTQDAAKHALVYTLPALVATTIHFKVRVEQTPDDAASGASSIHPLHIKCDSQTLAVKLRHGTNGLLQIGGDAVAGNADLTVANVYPKRTWFGIDIAVSVPSPSTAVFYVETDLSGSTPQMSGPVPCAAPDLQFGGIVSGTGSYELYMDDIVVE